MVDEISKEVDKLIKKYKTRNPFEIAKALNIEVRFHDLGNLKGYYFYQSRMRYIVIHKNLDAAFKLIICAHELVSTPFQNYPKSAVENSPFNRLNFLQIC